MPLEPERRNLLVEDHDARRAELVVGLRGEWSPPVGADASDERPLRSVTAIVDDFDAISGLHVALLGSNTIHQTPPLWLLRFTSRHTIGNSRHSGNRARSHQRTPPASTSAPFSANHSALAPMMSVFRATEHHSGS